MEGLFWGVLLGFFLGSFGYILTRFILSPVFLYRKLKRGLAEDLARAEKLAVKTHLGAGDLSLVAGFRVHAKALTLYVETRMPLWFQLSLERRNENPLLAASELLVLADIRIPSHLWKRIVSVRQHMGLAGILEKAP